MKPITCLLCVPPLVREVLMFFAITLSPVTSTDAMGAQYLIVVTGHPVLLYSLPVNGSEVSCVSLDDFFPSGGLGYWTPSLVAAPLTGKHKNMVLIYERKVSHTK